MHWSPRYLGLKFFILAASLHPAWAADPALPYGINAHLPSSVLLDKAVAAGIAWVRVDFNWWMMEPQRGIYDWAITDAVVDDARARGLNVYATLAYTPDWANGGQGRNVPPTNPDDWYTFVYTTVNRYRDRVRHWGMWNEPNFEHFFAGSPEQYIAAILRIGAQAVRDADPNSLVLGPELAMEGNWGSWLYTVLDQAADAVDIVTQHTYQDNGWQVLERMGGDNVRNMPTPRSIMQITATDDKALWLTETGWNTADVSEVAQGIFYDQVLDGVEAYDWLDKVFFYQLIDEPETPDRWGILRADLTPKPAYCVIQRHAQQAVEPWSCWPQR